VLRRRTSPDKLIVKMWLFPALSIATIVAILAVLVQMYLQEKVRPQLLQSLLVWALMLVVYLVIAWRRGSVDALEPATRKHKANRVLVLANRTVAAVELLDELRRIDHAGEAKYFLCVPADFVDTSPAEPTRSVWLDEAEVEAAHLRLADTIALLQAEGLSVRGEFGDHLPIRALEYGVAEFTPDQIVISTYPLEDSLWLQHDVVDRARTAYPAIPVTHVIASLPAVMV
jgi:GABA permease